MLRAARRSRPILIGTSLLPCVVALACAFDSAGNGFPEGMSVGEGDTTAAADEDTGADDDADVPSTATRGDDPDGPSTTASTAASTTLGTTGGATTDDDTSGDDHDSAATHSTSPEGDDTGSTGEPGDVGCPQSIFDVYWVEDGVVEAPMMLVEADAADNPKVASSPVADSGSVTIEIDFACPGEYTLWGLVWDYDPGAWGEPDPDSFYFDVGGEEATWRYGCQTAESTSGLSWQRLASLSAQPCEASYIALSVYGAGTVELTLRNREAGDGSQVAGIAAIAVSDDPGANPASLYEPY